MMLIFSSLRAYKLQLQKWSFTKYNTTRLRRDEANPQQKQEYPSTCHDNKTSNNDNRISNTDNATSNTDNATSNINNTNNNIYSVKNVSSHQFLNSCVERSAGIFPARPFHQVWQLNPARTPPLTSPLFLFQTEDIYAVNDKGQTPLHQAIQTLIDSRATHVRIDTVNQLLKAGASPRRIDVTGDTPLHLAVRCIESEVGLSLVLATFLKNNHRCLRFRNVRGATVFSNLWDRARTSPSRDHTLNFPSLGTDIGSDMQLEDMQANSSFATLFKIFITVSKAVMKSRASSLNYADFGGRPSGQWRNRKACSALGQTHNQEHGNRILHFLASTGVSGEVDVELADLLLQHGANVNSQDQNGETPLMKVLRYRRCDPGMAPLARFLVDNGADLCARDLDENCAIWDSFRAFAAGSPETFLSLAYGFVSKKGFLEEVSDYILRPVQKWTESEAKKIWDQLPIIIGFHMQREFKTPRQVMSLLKWVAEDLESLTIDETSGEFLYPYSFPQAFTKRISTLRVELMNMGHSMSSPAFDQVVRH